MDSKSGTTKPFLEPFGHMSGDQVKPNETKYAKYTFGTSRSAMKKTAIDEIVSEAGKGLHAPGPDRYQASKSDFEITNPTMTFTMGKRRHILE